MIDLDKIILLITNIGFIRTDSPSNFSYGFTNKNYHYYLTDRYNNECYTLNKFDIGISRISNSIILIDSPDLNELNVILNKEFNTIIRRNKIIKLTKF